MRLLTNRNSVQGMVTYYVSLYSFVGVCISMTQDTPTTWQIIGFILTLLATLVQDIHWYRRSRAHPHDMQLIEKLTALLRDSKAELFLQQHDFTRTTYDDIQLTPLREISDDWQGVDYEFVRPELAPTWQAFREQLDELLTLLTTQGALRGAGFSHLNPPPRPEDEVTEAEKEHRRQRAERANELGRAMFNEFQSLRRTYHRYTGVLAET